MLILLLSSSVNKVQYIQDNLVSSGDSLGEIKIWDVRCKKKQVFSFKEQSEEISDITYSYNTNFLLATSIDGTLGVYDLRKKPNYKLYALSDFIEDELHCLKIMENGKKVVCGTSEGPLAIFNWDWFGDYKDRILGHPGTINCIEKFNEDMMFTGCEDGHIRIVSLYLKNIEKVIGDAKKLDIKENKEFNDIELLSLNMSKYDYIIIFIFLFR